MSGKGLSFLSKKSWHTGSIRHMEKVWKAEQMSAAEQKKIQELQRELQKERARKEILDAVPEEAKGGKEKLDWMYRGVLVSSTTEQLNKPYVPTAEKEDFSVPSLLQKKEPTSATHDDWSKLNEDPLLQIRQREQDAMKSIATNPLVMRKIAKQLKQLEKKEKHSHKEHKSTKKEKKEKRDKRERKEKKEKKAHYRDAAEDSAKHYPAEEVKHIMEHRDRSPPRGDYSSSSSRRRSRSPARSYRRGSRSPPARYQERRDSRSPPSSYRSYRRGSRSPPSYRSDRRRSRSPPPTRSPPSYRSERRRSRSPPPSSSSSSSRRNSRPSNKLSEEEIQKRLQEMQQDGQTNYQTRLNQYKQRTEENKNSLEIAPQTKEDANFLRYFIILFFLI